ncbi:MAG: hypothetical protein WEB04_01670 [Dehalococcoidia bacterium]
MRPLLALALTPVALVLVLSACGGGDGGDSKAPAYSGPTNVVVFSAKEADGTFALYSITPETGAEPERLTTEPQAISYPRWSPDGARIAYLTGAGATAALRVIELASGKVSTAGDNAPPGAAASWSPDGKELAYIDAAGGGLVRFYDVASGETTASENIPGTEVDWSSSGDLAVVTDGNLVRVDPDSGDGELLAGAAEPISGPRWSPDGTTVAYSTGEDAQLYVVRPDSEPANLGRGSQPAWTADSARLAFAYEPQTGVSDIYTVAVTPAGAPAQLTTSITFDRWPSWSPDGTRVAYVAAADNVTAFVCIAQFAVPGGDCLQLPNGLLPMSLEWSPE